MSSTRYVNRARAGAHCLPNPDDSLSCVLADMAYAPSLDRLEPDLPPESWASGYTLEGGRQIDHHRRPTRPPRRPRDQFPLSARRRADPDRGHPSGRYQRGRNCPTSERRQQDLTRIVLPPSVRAACTFAFGCSSPYPIGFTDTQCTLKALGADGAGTADPLCVPFTSYALGRGFMLWSEEQRCSEETAVRMEPPRFEVGRRCVGFDCAGCVQIGGRHIGHREEVGLVEAGVTERFGNKLAGIRMGTN